MKRRLLALLLAVALCGCSAPKPGETTSTPPALQADLTAGDLAAIAVDSQGDKQEYALLPDGDTEFYVNQVYGLDGGAVAEAAIYTAGGVDAREIAVLRLADGADTAGVARALAEYRESRQGDFFGYAPDQADLAGRGLVLLADSGRWAALLLCGDPEGAEKALTKGGGETWTRAGYAPAPIVTEVNPGLDTSGFVPFDPPLAVDMSLYDDTPIVRAWETGDESGLDGKQAAILAKCREIFSETIAEDMTDFQKELQLYRWLTSHGEYDHTHYDPRTPLGREDNTNPYGMLVLGYGICLGYAESFRLLMDLAGVECITVTGAAFHNDEDHAWNMVKLEGEWYCVDPTWDNAPSCRYFNVTSEYLRQTDHQWDYANVPEATATKFYWNGQDARPTERN